MKENKKKEKKIIKRGRIYINATFNNTIVTICDDKGMPFLVGSAGMYGFTGTRKSTPYASTVTVQSTIQKAKENYSFSVASIFLKGVGPGRTAALRAVKASDLEIERIIDITPIPHNGVRPPKPKRV